MTCDVALVCVICSSLECYYLISCTNCRVSKRRQILHSNIAMYSPTDQRSLSKRELAIVRDIVTAAFPRCNGWMDVCWGFHCSWMRGWSFDVTSLLHTIWPNNYSACYSTHTGQFDEMIMSIVLSQKLIMTETRRQMIQSSLHHKFD